LPRCRYISASLATSFRQSSSRLPPCGDFITWSEGKSSTMPEIPPERNLPLALGDAVFDVLGFNSCNVRFESRALSYNNASRFDSEESSCELLLRFSCDHQLACTAFESLRHSEMAYSRLSTCALPRALCSVLLIITQRYCCDQHWPT
jgi:hypothetical protein